MNQIDTIQMMERCAEEIAALRKQLDALRPRAEAFDAVQQILGMARGNSSAGYGEDLLWRLKKAIAEETAKLMPKEPVEQELAS